jgi:general secretion pathway protein M
MNGLRAALGAAWNRAAPRERMWLVSGGVLVALALAYALIWQPLLRDLDRTGEALTRDRATLALLKSYGESRATGAVIEAAPVDVRAAVERALDARQLRNAAAPLEPRDGRVSLVLGAVPFDALVALLDDLARTDHLRVIDARLTARVEPGMVRAELTVGR